MGSRPFNSEDEAWAPPQVVVNAAGKERIYYRGEIKECSFEECKNLDVAAAWNRRHVVDMLMGDSKWDNTLRKPVC